MTELEAAFNNTQVVFPELLRLVANFMEKYYYLPVCFTMGGVLSDDELNALALFIVDLAELINMGLD